VNEARERSYYEIALTNAQVLVAFGILLACVAGAFLSGMWVARESLRDRLEAAESAPAAAEPAQGEASPDTFEFFGGDDTPAGATDDRETPSRRAEGAAGADESQPSDAATAGAGSIAARGAGAGETGAGASGETRPRTGDAERTASESTAVEAARERAEPSERRPAAEAPSVAARAAPPEESRASSSREAASSQPAATAPAAVSEADPAPGSVVIQVFSSSDEGQANGLVSRLRGDGFRAFLSPVEVNGRTLYRVRVGPYDSRPAAESDAAELRRRHRLETWFPRS
jgi:cell division septation protein DedD